MYPCDQCIIIGMELERRQLKIQVKAAETAGEIKIVKAALKSWQAEHPYDLEINTWLGQLSVREAWLQINGEWH
jgi:hypothetical protein